MSIDLPRDFTDRMKKLPGFNFGEFLESYEKPPFKGLRFTKKARKDTVELLTEKWNLEKIPWTETGYYYSSELRPGLSPYHDAGVYYIQEPSAMAVAEAAGIKESDCVLDLCASPGGKSTRAAELAKCVLCNEIVPSRAKILSSNIERLGITNCIICSAAPERIAETLGAMFDVVLADAPCSGEGMMRKDVTAIEEWSVDNVLFCVERQKEILSQADRCLKTGGKLVYSTCTFEPLENELQIRSFLDSHPEYELISQKTFYPHLDNGEGQYYAVLRKGNIETISDDLTADSRIRQMEKMLQISGIHILRSGLMKGELKTDKKKNNLYVPSHAEVMASSFAESPFENAVNLTSEELAVSFLKGNQLSVDKECMEFKNENDSFLGVYYNGYPLGLGKKTGSVLKNHLPKGLRRIS